MIDRVVINHDNTVLSLSSHRAILDIHFISYIHDRSNNQVSQVIMPQVKSSPKSLVSKSDSSLLFFVKSHRIHRLSCGLKLRRASYLPGPDVDHHVMLVPHTDNVFSIGGEIHTRDAIFVLLELGHLPPLRHVPQSHRRQVTTLVEKEQIITPSWWLKTRLVFLTPFIKSSRAGCKQPPVCPVYSALREIILQPLHRYLYLDCSHYAQGSKGQQLFV